MAGEYRISSYQASLLTSDNQVITAAIALAHTLQHLAVPYAIAGGAACILLGGKRTTHDLDVVVDIDGGEVRALKERIAALDTRFRSVGNSLYYGSSSTVPIELLTTRNFTWPDPLAAGCRTIALPGHEEEIVVLGPAALLFSKSGRTANAIGATRPQTQAKLRTDLVDVRFLCSILQPQDLASTLTLYAPDKQARIRSNLGAIARISPPLRRLCAQL